jgi:hypothetical protein
MHAAALYVALDSLTVGPNILWAASGPRDPVSSPLS